MTDAPREHILLTVLGISPKETAYTWPDRSVEPVKKLVATAALYDLLPPDDRPSRILAICTPEAEKDSLDKLREGLPPGLPVQPIHVQSEATAEAVNAFLATVTAAVPDGVDLTVDVTHGFRHQSFLTYIGVLYLTAFRDVRLKAAYYGMFSTDGGPSWFMDIQPLVELPEWFHAVRVLRDTGSAQVMANLVKDSAHKDAESVATALGTLSEAYASGLPIELGQQARRFLVEQKEPLQEVLDKQRLPLAHELVQDFTGVLHTQQLTQELTGPDWKKNAVLDRTELERQARLIDGYLDRRDYPNAFRLMREWVVLWAMWCMDDTSQWLDYHSREFIAGFLHKIKKSSVQDAVPEGHQVIREMWGRLADLRNRYAHHAFDGEVTLTSEGNAGVEVAYIRDIWEKRLHRVPKMSFDLPPRVLVSPIGTRPGVLFSALHAAEVARVTRCLVICSADTKDSIQEACKEAGYSGDIKHLILKDAFGGARELNDLIAGAKKYLKRGDPDVFVNVTGGTALMGVLADRIAGKARGMRRPVRQFVLIDRRSPAEQDADPYQVGEPCWLDDPAQELGDPMQGVKA